MSCQQNQQKCQLPAKCLPKYPPKHPPKAPQALAPCPPPAPSCCVPSCCISGFGSCCSLVSHRFPSVYLCQPQPSNCCEVEPSGCSSCCHSFGATADLQPWRSKRATAKEQSGADITSHSRFYSSLSSWIKLPRCVHDGFLFFLKISHFLALALVLGQEDLNAGENSTSQSLISVHK